MAPPWRSRLDLFSPAVRAAPRAWRHASAPPPPPRSRPADNAMHRTSSPSQAIARLSELATDEAIDGHSVLSLYLSFDPSELPHLRERHMQADALLDEAERHRPAKDGAPHEERLDLREDIERVREFLTDQEIAVQPAHGLAVFCCAHASLFEVVVLPRPVEPSVTVDQHPNIEPLVELAAPERWCVLLINRRSGRVLRGTRDRLAEVAHFHDDVHGWHAQGGWSQARYQRGIEHEVDEHIRNACARLLEHFRQRSFDRLLIASPVELRHRVEHELHADLRTRLTGHVEIDVEHATADEVRRRASPVIEADERARELAALDRLREGLAPTGHAATGLNEVLEMLNEQRVQMLLIAHGFTASGFICPQCGRLYTAEIPCPADGAAGEPQQDIVERAVELALERSSAEILIVRHQPDALSEYGQIAALLRY